MKSKKMAKLGYSKRELSNINVDTIKAKCFECNFDNNKYNEWFKQIEKFDEWVSQNVDQNKLRVEVGRRKYSNNKE